MDKKNISFLLSLYLILFLDTRSSWILLCVRHQLGGLVLRD